MVNDVKLGGDFISNLTIAFIVLKLCGIISWSWWLVFAPIWITALFVLIVIILVLVIKWALD